ncbi:hypothetical protein Pcinc_017080 [Petrolisthes cinctipes]|uniref:Uncharacterized protein n=1 Tax=Petrolisthes cinctipes TaxID=88211 RepID=A0AAE1KL41_PETCI|nr:hypothetical protein Pcinc_017080 [Petrolisthes cinctipes]
MQPYSLGSKFKTLEDHHRQNKTAELCLDQLLNASFYLSVLARSLTTPTSPALLAVRASATQQSTLRQAARWLNLKEHHLMVEPIVCV